jgi:hypothetical protein
MADATLVLTFNAVTGVFDLLPLRRRSDRPYAALRDDVATTAHYMGMDQPIPVPEVIDPPKAKPALAGLSVIASEGRYQGLGFTDA